jgi:hypothetical protein
VHFFLHQFKAQFILPTIKYEIIWFIYSKTFGANNWAGFLILISKAKTYTKMRSIATMVVTFPKKTPKNDMKTRVAKKF